MNSFKKGLTKIRRFLDVWKTEGFKSAFQKSISTLLKKLNLGVTQKIENKIETSDHQDIYSSYISTGRNTKTGEYVDLPSYDLSHQNLPVKVLAFYLPQYYPIPENDNWWGKGFTEWTNVSKAVPNFVEQYQPRLPGELGFYDLRVPEIQLRQVALAQKFGIHGFCFYYYWFGGKRLLDAPLDQFVNHPDINFPFCLCWANENWTRIWDGLDQDVLIAQHHSPDGDLAFIKDISPYLANPKYIKINGRSMLIVYRPQILPDPELTAKRWRGYCKNAGLDDLFLVAIQSGRLLDPRKIGFDAALEFPPHGVPVLPQINKYLKITNPDFTGMVYDYRKIAEQMGNQNHPEYRLFKTVITGWDNTPRRQDQPLIFHNSTPQVYQSWLTSAINNAVENSPAQERFVFINAWNEWAESTYLEPDRKFGYAYLDATARAIHSMMDEKVITDPIPGSQIQVKKHSDTAVIFHLYYPELWGETLSYLNNLNLDFDLFVSIPENANFNRDLIVQDFPQASIFHCSNRGRDIASFIHFFTMINPLGYEYICKIHTKKSLHRPDGTEWRVEILNELLGSETQIAAIKQHLNNDKIGIIGPKNHIISTRLFMGGNQELVTQLADRLNLKYAGEDFNFIAGSMYWFKPSAIAPILNLNLLETDFPRESGQKDGTIAHALERIMGLVASKQGYQVIQTGTFTGESNDDFTYADPFIG